MKWLQKPYDQNKEIDIRKKGHNKLLSRLLAQRNVNIDDNNFFEADYQKLSHPHALNGVKEAVDMFCKAITEKELIGVIGDYDCDGIISSVMIKELCNNFGLECNVFLPSRLEHGYGLTENTIKSFATKFKSIPSLLFVVDCGTNSYKEIEQLKKIGINKVIVIDHHLPSDNISKNADALISWHFSENYNEMCSTGQVYQFIRGVRWVTKKVNPIEFLTYAAIGTIADVSPIIGDNRIIVRHGLKGSSINSIVASGLISLMEQSKIAPYDLTQEDVLFKIAPKINAAGRILHPDIAYKLLIEHDKAISDEMAEQLVEFNEERKKLQKKIESEAVAMAEKQNCSHGILVANKDWHIGVVGIVAAKLTEIFHKPSLVIGQHNGVWRGSGRTVSKINIKEVLDGCSSLFIRYGGHADAVGMELKSNVLANAHFQFNDACKKYIEDNNISLEEHSYYDAKLALSAVTQKLGTFLKDNLYPYCSANNAQPIFMLPAVKIVNLKIKDGDGWRMITFNLEKNGEISKKPFRMFSSKFGSDMEGTVADVLFTFSQKQSGIDPQVVDIVPIKIY